MFARDMYQVYEIKDDWLIGYVFMCNWLWLNVICHVHVLLVYCVN